MQLVSWRSLEATLCDALDHLRWMVRAWALPKSGSLSTTNSDFESKLKMVESADDDLDWYTIL